MKEGKEVIYEGELITRRDAVEEGLKTYYTGKECKHGHIDKRQTCSGQCVECKRLRTKAWRLKPDSEKFLDKKVAKVLPTQEELLARWDYDALTGNLYWKLRGKKESETEKSYLSWLSGRKGKVAGSRHYANGYIELRTLDGALHKGHRIIWKMVTGEEPNLPIDHENGIPWDNRWSNLRLATNQENARNSVTYSTSEYKGVTKSKKDITWMTSWCIEDKNYTKKGFITAKEAAKYYDKMVYPVYGEFAKLNFPEDYNI